MLTVKNLTFRISLSPFSGTPSEKVGNPKKKKNVKTTRAEKAKY
jgi:hypothetical protein